MNDRPPSLPGATPVAKKNLIRFKITPKALFLAAGFLLLAARLFRLVYLYSVNIFYTDQWAIADATLFEKHSLIEIFRWQYGPHRQGLGGLLQKWFNPLVQWNSRDEAFAMATIICCAALSAFWLKRRLFGKLEYIDLVIALIFLTPVQYEVFTETLNPSHGPLPLLLVVLYCIGWTLSSTKAKYAAVLLCNLLLIYTGFGLFMGFVTPLVLAGDYLRSRSGASLIASLVAILCLLSFFIGYTLQPAVDCFSPKPHNPLHYLLFVGFMLSSFVQIRPSIMLVPAILTGGLLLFAVVVVFFGSCRNLLRDWVNSNLIVFILLTYSLLFCFATAYGRLCLGLGASQGSRYMTYLVLLFFALYLTAIKVRIGLERRIFVGLTFALALMSAVRVAPEDRTNMLLASNARKEWRDCYFSTHDIQTCDLQTHSFIYWHPEPTDLGRKLEFLERHHLNLYAKRLR